MSEDPSHRDGLEVDVERFALQILLFQGNLAHPNQPCLPGPHGLVTTISGWVWLIAELGLAWFGDSEPQSSVTTET
jgi:hypothetical protein